jgi:hypothetical protein
VNSGKSSLRLAAIAYRLVSDPDLIEKLEDRCPDVHSKETEQLSPIEVTAFYSFITQGISINALTWNVQATHLEGRWWAA